MRRKGLWRRVLYIALAVVGLYLGACWALAGKYLQPTRYVAELPHWMREAQWGGQTCFVSPRLAEKKTVPVVFVLAHGLGGNRSSFTETARTLDGAGYGVILPPMAGQDVSTEDRIGFGVEESDLLAKIVGEARALPGHPKVIVGGVSMGGAAAWLTTAKVPVDGVITESAYAEADRAAEDFLNSRIKGGSIFLRPVVIFGGWRSGIALKEIRPVDAARGYRGPSVVIHAGNDGLFARAHAEELAEAARTKPIYFDGVGHAHGRELEPERYDGFFLDLARRVLTPLGPPRNDHALDP